MQLHDLDAYLKLAPNGPASRGGFSESCQKRKITDGIRFLYAAAQAVAVLLSTRQKIPSTSTKFRVCASVLDLLIFLISNVVTREYEISYRFGSFRALLKTPVQIELEETRCDFGLHSF